MTPAKPFIKWAGGKRRLVPELMRHVPEDFNGYFEPFLGGGAMFFALAGSGRLDGADFVWLSDTNAELVNAYNCVQSSLPAVIHRLKSHKEKHCADHYYDVRSWSPKNLQSIDRAARFIYLNKTCFNGLYRVNKKNKFNVPIGKYKNPKICDEDTLRAANQVMQYPGCEVVCESVEASVKLAQPGDLVYFDPPYIPLNKTSDFTAYTRDGFTLRDQEDLRDLALNLKSRGVHIILSNSDTAKTRELYSDGFDLQEVQARRSINSAGSKRGPVGELIIT